MECDDFRMAVVMNVAEYNEQKDKCKSVAKRHLMRACNCTKFAFCTVYIVRSRTKATEFSI